jgi:hypothetical protein
MAHPLPALHLPAALLRLLPALLLPLTLSAALFLPACASAATSTSKAPRPPTTNPVALALKLAEQYWHGEPACGTPTIVLSAHQLPTSNYETVTSPEPANSVVEMWTEVQRCTITINASLWPSWRSDDESFQWFCDAMTHEVGHLFGHLDSGQTNPSSITYPFLDSTSPNFSSVPECHGVTLHYGSEEIRDEEVFRAH